MIVSVGVCVCVLVCVTLPRVCALFVFVPWPGVAWHLYFPSALATEAATKVAKCQADVALKEIGKLQIFC